MIGLHPTNRLPPVDDTLLRCTIFSGRESVVGQIRPLNFATATAELASIADAGKAWRGPRRSATPPRRQAHPTPRLKGAAPAPGHEPPPAPQNIEGILPRRPDAVPVVAVDCCPYSGSEA
jgi:hypothetical protein